MGDRTSSPGQEYCGAAAVLAHGRGVSRAQSAVQNIDQLKQQNPNATVGGVDFSNNFKALDTTEELIKTKIREINAEQEQLKLQQNKQADRGGTHDDAELIGRRGSVQHERQEGHCLQAPG